MSDKVRLNLYIDPDADKLLIELAGGERLRGVYLSQLIRRAHADTLSGGSALQRKLDGVAFNLEYSAREIRQAAGLSPIGELHEAASQATRGARVSEEPPDSGQQPRARGRKKE